MITGATTLLALIADPVAQARSPGLVTTILQRRGRFGDFVFVPMQVPEGALGDVVTAIRRIGNFAGAVVSMPHKRAMVPLIDEVLPDARIAGAVNVIRRDAGGRLTGTTLDGEGFVAGLMGAGHGVDGKTCAVVGAGGAGSAIAFALARHRCATLAIVNRTEAKAEELAAQVRTAFSGVDVRVGDDGRRFDVTVNATSLGMRSGDALPMSRGLVERSAVVAECVVTQDMTPLLAMARDLGRTIHPGLPMLTAQLDLLLDFMGVATGVE